MKKAISRLVNEFQKCQRNFNLEKVVPEDTAKWLLDIGYTTPTKQNLDTFEIVCVRDRDIIKKFVKAATNSPEESQDMSPSLKEMLKEGRTQNPQIDANLLFLFFIKRKQRKSKMREEREKGKPSTKYYYKATTNLEIGLSASAIGIAAHSIGMKTGFCRCIDHDALPEILLPYNINKYDLEVMLGVGYPLFKDHTKNTDGKYYSERYKKIIPRKLII
tara:strand:+ start:1955 stop:2608 length:654 start_codon:yes stop_codon:yes gene_type:complete